MHAWPGQGRPTWCLILTRLAFGILHGTRDLLSTPGRPDPAQSPAWEATAHICSHPHELEVVPALYIPTRPELPGRIRGKVAFERVRPLRLPRTATRAEGNFEPCNHTHASGSGWSAFLRARGKSTRFWRGLSALLDRPASGPGFSD